MVRETITEAPTIEEALDAALEELGVQQDAVEYEVLEGGGRSGLFGMGGEKHARVRVWLKQEFLSEAKAEPEGADSMEDEHEEEPPTEVLRSAAEPAELTDEELDRVADEAVSAIQSILDGFGIEATIEEYEGDEGEIILDVVGGDLGVLIGRHGKTLDGLQVLVSAITNRRLGFRYPVLVDIEGYRNRRRVKLEEIASRSAERAVRQGSPVKLRPMSSLERRVVHVALRDNPRVTTASEGEEPFRCVVVKPKGR